jgi:hypothetical protein
MNKRIKELWSQAGGHYDSGNQHTWPQYTIDDPEKFAELIVRECADILMKPEYAMNHPEELSDYNKGWVNGRLLGIEHIKEYFGVEQ